MQIQLQFLYVEQKNDYIIMHLHVVNRVQWHDSPSITTVIIWITTILFPIPENGNSIWTNIPDTDTSFWISSHGVLAGFTLILGSRRISPIHWNHGWDISRVRDSRATKDTSSCSVIFFLPLFHTSYRISFHPNSISIIQTVLIRPRSNNKFFLLRFIIFQLLCRYFR